MTAPTADHAWPPASPAQLASALLTYLQHVTSSARLFLTGCFQCEFLKAGCWRRQEEQDGAWFDSDKLQVEHPYCYVNPLAVSEAHPSTAPSHPPLPAALAPEPRPESPFKASPQRSPGSALVPSGFGTQPSDALQKRLKKSNTNGGLFSEIEWQHVGEDGATEEDASLRDRVGLKDGVARYVRGQGGRTSLVQSFAAKLEADLKKIEYDRQRAEGEMLKAASEADDDDQLQEQRSSEDRVDAVLLPGPSSIFPYEIEDSTCLQTDVWKSSELEDAFECYNMAAFYSYGAAFPAAEKFASKVRGEKFEEVFPVSHHHHNNNNNIKVYKPESGIENTQPLTLPNKDEDVIENVRATHENREKRSISEDELKQFVHACVLAESVIEIDEKCFLNDTDNNRNSKDIINFGGKSFNKLLIFNLVKSVMSECATQYPRSLSLCDAYSVHLVQRKVIKLILEEDRIEDNLCGLQMFHSPVLQIQQEKQLARRLVESVAAGEIRAEDREWQDFKNEEQEIKKTIFSEMLHDLITDTSDVFKGLVAKKLAMIQNQERDQGAPTLCPRI